MAKETLPGTEDLLLRPMSPEELRVIMKQCGWSQGELARLLPLKSTRTIRYWLSGKKPIRPLVAERIRSLIPPPRSAAP